jgi:hypothetical protein
LPCTTVLHPALRVDASHPVKIRKVQKCRNEIRIKAQGCPILRFCLGWLRQPSMQQPQIEVCFGPLFVGQFRGDQFVVRGGESTALFGRHRLRRHARHNARRLGSNHPNWVAQ